MCGEREGARAGWTAWASITVNKRRRQGSGGGTQMGQRERESETCRLLGSLQKSGKPTGENLTTQTHERGNSRKIIVPTPYLVQMSDCLNCNSNSREIP